MKRIAAALCLILILSFQAGCENKQAGGETAAAQVSASEAARPEVIIDGMTFTVNGTTYDITKLDSSSNAIVQCDYITDTVFILECHISPNMSFYAVFNADTGDYVNSFYGVNCTWLDNNPESIIYTRDNTVFDASGQALYTAEITQTQYIYELGLSQDGKTVTVTVVDNAASEHDRKTYTFDRR